MTSTLSHWYFDWILWLQWFQWRHSLFKLRPIEKRIAFVFCQRRNKLGIFAVPACTCPRCFTVVPHCLWCSPLLFSWSAPTVYFTRIFIAMVRSHPAVHTRFCRWYNHIPLKFSFLWGYVTFLVLKCRNPILVITCIVHTDTYTNKGSWKWFFSIRPTELR